MCLAAFVSLSASAESTAPKPLDANVALAAQGVTPIGPKIGIRIGGGNWNDFCLNAGIDATFNIPLLPVPELRVDGEVWGDASSIGVNRHGDALSVLGVQTFIMGYAGLGPSFYFTDDQGDHRSGLGLKLLLGMSLPGSSYVEAGLILGPTTPPLFISFGRHF